EAPEIGSKTIRVWLAIAAAVPSTSSLKSLVSLVAVRRPTTRAKTTRIAKVRAAETAARRQRTGQVRGWGRRTALAIGAGRPEHVARAPLGVEEAGLAALLELAAQVRDEDVDRVRHRRRVVAPHLLEQALARDHEPLVSHQVLEQLELAVRELDLALPAPDLAGVRVEHQVADHERRAAARRPAPHERAQPRQQLLALEGLDEVVVGARVQPLDPVAGLAARRQDEDRHVAGRAQAPAHLDAVETRQAEVEDDEIGDELLGHRERLHAVSRGLHVVPLLAQRAAQDVGDLRIVLDDEHPSSRSLARQHVDKVRGGPGPGRAYLGSL